MLLEPSILGYWQLSVLLNDGGLPPGTRSKAGLEAGKSSAIPGHDRRVLKASMAILGQSQEWLLEGEAILL